MMEVARGQAELYELAEALWRAAPGERRAALRRLADFAEEDARRWAEEGGDSEVQPWHGLMYGGLGGLRYPKELVWALVECLEESPEEAAPLVLALCGGHLWASEAIGTQQAGNWRLGWERFFSEASLARLRTLLLGSEDPAVAKALLRLFAFASKGLPDFRHSESWVTSSEAWAVEGRASLARHDAFLLDCGVLGKLRGLLCDGDPHRLLDPALYAYEGMTGGLPASVPHLPGPVRDRWMVLTYGPFHLLRPILHDLALNFDKLCVNWERTHRHYINFHLSPLERAEEAVEAVEGFLLPWLARAEDLSPACLRWLASAFPFGNDKYRRFYSHYNVPLTPALQPWACPLGLRLRSRVVDALTGVLKRGRLSSAQAWALLAGAVDWAGCREEPELFCSLVATWGSLPVPPESLAHASKVSLRLLDTQLDKAGSGLLVGSGGFRTLARLLGQREPLLPPPWAAEKDLFTALGRAQRLLSWPAFVHAPAFVLSRAEVRARLLCWQDSGLDAALRHLLSLHNLPSPHLLYGAQALLATATDLLRDQPLTHHSHLPHEIHFPLD